MLWPEALARLRSISLDLLPRRPPPHCLRDSSYLSELQRRSRSEHHERDERRTTENIQVSLGGRDEGGELALILRLDLLDGEDGGSLLVDDCAETGLTLDDDVGDTHLAAESGEEDDELDGVNIVGDDDESSLLGLDEGNTVVETVLGEKGLLVLYVQTRIGMGIDGD